jgi:hypothetical protein
MKPEINIFPADFNIAEFDTHFNVFHELMSKKVQEILVVSSPYDAYIMEEDGSLASKIIQIHLTFKRTLTWKKGKWRKPRQNFL